MQSNGIADLFSAKGLVFEERLPNTERLYSLLDGDKVLAENVTLAAAKKIAAARNLLFADGYYSYIETYTKLRDGTILFSGDNRNNFSHDASHILPHVSLHVHGKEVYDNISVNDAHDLITLWMSDERFITEYESNLGYLADTLPVYNEMIKLYPPFLKTVEAYILRLFPTVHSLIGSPYIIHYNGAANNAPAPTTIKPNVDKFGKPRVARLPKTTKISEIRYEGIPESVLEAHGYIVLDVATLHPIVSGTQQTLTKFFEDYGTNLHRVRIVRYSNRYEYLMNILDNGYTAFYRGHRIVSGTKAEVIEYLDAEHKLTKIGPEDVSIVRAAENIPPAIVAFLKRLADAEKESPIE